MNKERNKLKLSVDQHDQLTELLVNESVKVLTETVLDSLCAIMEKRVLTFDLGSRSDRELTIEKARAEGARKLQLELRTYIDGFKKSVLSKR